MRHPPFLRRRLRSRSRRGIAPAEPDEPDRLDLAPGRVVIVASSVNADARPIQATRSLFAADCAERVVDREP